ncbi:Crp/Fnr family transcriptional regulator [Candidatus Magnetomonas plexicatena]|uniref:Crp/Fnr family transcriptional regulator n=1 Tax=Candidatus Magnetomonas plexicatena TaxID=2552947 RepID=UPI0010FFD980|nr:Crp/Fnr family transcriptional regulator [Nitrospirales bacterium LBB_01]
MELKDVPIFEGLTVSELKEIEPYIQFISLRKKEAVFNEGDKSDWFYIVAAGKVKITKLSQDGKELILEIVQDGELFGALAVFRGFPYPANAIAMENAKVVRILRKNLFRILDRFPILMFKITSIIGDRMKNSHETLKNIALERVESRIASLLIKLSDKSPTPGQIDIKLTKQDIAEMVGTTVETSIRTLSKFKKEGLITDKKGLHVITDKEGLEQYAN